MPDEKPQGRNLKKKEVEKFIKEFASIIQNININGKPFAIRATTKAIATNPELTIEEIQSVLKVQDKSKVDFLRQLYVRGGYGILKTLFPDENIVNIPTLSFTEEGNSIQLNY